MTEKMRLEDLDEVTAIEAAVFPDPWGRGMFLSELSDHSLSYVEREAKRVVGYLILWPILDELCIMNLAVHPARQRRGLGEYLVRFALRLGAERGMRRATLEVRASNEGAQHLYRKCGFQQIGARRNYYTRPREDALLFDCVIPEGVRPERFELPTP